MKDLPQRVDFNLAFVHIELSAAKRNEITLNKPLLHSEARALRSIHNARFVADDEDKPIGEGSIGIDENKLRLTAPHTIS